MKTQCPHCGAVYNVEDSRFGESVTCSKCNYDFVIAPLKAEIGKKTKADKSFENGLEKACKILVVFWLIAIVMFIATSCGASDRVLHRNSMIVLLGAINIFILAFGIVFARMAKNIKIIADFIKDK